MWKGRWRDSGTERQQAEADLLQSTRPSTRVKRASPHTMQSNSCSSEVRMRCACVRLSFARSLTRIFQQPRMHEGARAYTHIRVQKCCSPASFLALRVHTTSPSASALAGTDKFLEEDAPSSCDLSGTPPFSAATSDDTRGGWPAWRRRASKRRRTSSKVCSTLLCWPCLDASPTPLSFREAAPPAPEGRARGLRFSLLAPWLHFGLPLPPSTLPCCRPSALPAAVVLMFM